MASFQLLLIVAFALLVFGCVSQNTPDKNSFPFGLKSAEDCNNPIKDSVDGSLRLRAGPEKVLCLHEAAISYAYVSQDANGKTKAVDTCLSLIFVPNLDSDALKLAEVQRNTCLTDVATIFKDPQPCNYINQNLADNNGQDNVPIRGDTTMQALCQNKVMQAQTFNPNNYKCPLVFAGTFWFIWFFAFSGKH